MVLAISLIKPFVESVLLFPSRPKWMHAESIKFWSFVDYYAEVTWFALHDIGKLRSDSERPPMVELLVTKRDSSSFSPINPRLCLEPLRVPIYLGRSLK